MNTLERIMVQGALKAQTKYKKMTGGWWLWHGPESFLQHQVAAAIAEAEFYVFTEASPKLIRDEFDHPPQGAPPKGMRKRFDIVVWSNKRNEIKALVEIKRVGTLDYVLKDAQKLERFLKQKTFSSGSGYLLLYSEAINVKTLEEKWRVLGEELGNRWSAVQPPKFESPKGGEWSYSFHFLKYRSTRVGV